MTLNSGVQFPESFVSSMPLRDGKSMVQPSYGTSCKYSKMKSNAEVLRERKHVQPPRSLGKCLPLCRRLKCVDYPLRGFAELNGAEKLYWRRIKHAVSHQTTLRDITRLTLFLEFGASVNTHAGFLGYLSRGLNIYTISLVLL